MDSIFYNYVDWYRWEDSWEARWVQYDYSWSTRGPKNSQKCTFCRIATHIWTRGLSAWELRCLIIHGLWCRAQWSWMNTQWHWFELSMPPKVKCHGVNWKTIIYLLYKRFIQNLIKCSIWEIQPFETHVTLIWPWKVIQGQMSWGKLIIHRWLPICVSNKLWPEHA